MKNSILCKTTSKGQQCLYLQADGKEYYLFSQNYRSSVKDYYQTNVILDRALDYSANTGEAVRKTMEKLRTYIPYVEKEYGVCVLNKTKKAQQPKKTGRKYSDCDEYEVA